MQSNNFRNNNLSLGYELLKSMPNSSSNRSLGEILYPNLANLSRPPVLNPINPCQAASNRIDTILDETDSSFEELSYIPARSRLTYNNGFYVTCSAIFIDIRGSSSLTELHRRPVLAKLYKSFISEMVAVLNSSGAYEVGIRGDCVFGIFDTQNPADRDNILVTAAKAYSIVDLLNYKLIKKSYNPIRIGIGLSYGRALMVKAGQFGSGINDIIWLGDVVNEACKLCSYGNKDSYDYPIMISPSLYSHFSEEVKMEIATRPDLSSSFKYNIIRNCYDANFIFKDYQEWINRNM